MITELTQDLINKITTVPALQNRVGAAVGGTSSDPTMAQAPVPYVWIIFGGSSPTGDTQNGRKYRQEQYLFNVVVGISYGTTEDDLLVNQLPILEQVQQAVAGLNPYKYADLWEFQGVNLAKITADRMIYQLEFSVIGHHRTEDPNI